MGRYRHFQFIACEAIILCRTFDIEVSRWQFVSVFMVIVDLLENQLVVLNLVQT